MWLRFGLLLSFAVISLASVEETCQKVPSCHSTMVNDICSTSEIGARDYACTSRFSGFCHVKSDLQQYVMTHIEQSFQYLLMSNSFGNYKSNRPGFEKLYRKMSDEAWEESIELIKYITSRGFEMNFKESPFRKANVVEQGKVTTYADVSELKSLSLALEMQKFLAETAHNIHKTANKLLSNKQDVPTYHDPEVMSHIENEFVHKHAKTIRELTGHVNDLHKIIIGEGKDHSLATYLFDQHLQSVV